MQGNESDDNLLGIIKRGKFEEIESEINPTAFKYCESNSLLMAMKVRSYFGALVVCAHLLGPVTGLIECKLLFLRILILSSWHVISGLRERKSLRFIGC